MRTGDAQARSRADEALGQRVRERFVLADALHVVAVEHGFRSWPTFKRDTETQADTETRRVGRIGASPSATYAGWAERLLTAARSGEPDAVERLRARVPRMAGNGCKAIAERATLADAKICLARELVRVVGAVGGVGELRPGAEAVPRPRPLPRRAASRPWRPC